jgi:hypothetical protein
VRPPSPSLTTGNNPFVIVGRGWGVGVADKRRRNFYSRELKDEGNISVGLSLHIYKYFDFN